MDMSQCRKHLGHDIHFPAFDRDGNPNSFSDSELIEIQKQFQNVAEDFLPFDVNVTTIDPGVAALSKSSVNDTTWGIRAVNTQPTDGFGSGIGGIAYLNSFSYNQDTPVFTFNKGKKWWHDQLARSGPRSGTATSGSQ